MSIYVSGFGRNWLQPGFCQSRGQRPNHQIPQDPGNASFLNAELSSFWFFQGVLLSWFSCWFPDFWFPGFPGFLVSFSRFPGFLVLLKRSWDNTPSLHLQSSTQLTSADLTSSHLTSAALTSSHLTSCEFELSLLRPRVFLQHNVMFGFGSLSFMSCNVFRKHNV